MKQIEKLAEALNEIDVCRKTCEESIRDAINQFIQSTGVKPVSVGCELIDVSAFGDKTRKFSCAKVHLDYNPDVRFPNTNDPME